MPYSRRARFRHAERRLKFKPTRVRTVRYADGTEVRIGFRGNRSEVVSVLTPIDGVMVRGHARRGTRGVRRHVRRRA